MKVTLFSDVVCSEVVYEFDTNGCKVIPSDVSNLGCHAATQEDRANSQIPTRLLSLPSEFCLNSSRTAFDHQDGLCFSDVPLVVKTRACTVVAQFLASSHDAVAWHDPSQGSLQCWITDYLDCSRMIGPCVVIESCRSNVCRL